MERPSFIRRVIQSKIFQLLCIMAVILIATAIIKPTAFSLGNARQILNNVSYYGVFVIGMACILISGNIDFSMSGIATCAMLLFAEVLIWFPGVPWFVALLAALCAGAAAGLINAFFVQRLNLVPFIVTIATSSVFAGIAAWVTRGNQVHIKSVSFIRLSAIYFGPIPLLFLFMLLLFFLYSAMLTWTRFGRSVFMAGGNQSAARLAGLNPKRIKSILYVNNGVLCSIAGLIWASQQQMAHPTSLVTQMPHVTSLISVLLGGVSFVGGSGSLFGAFFGITTIQLLAYALQTMGLPLWIVSFVNGMLLVVAIAIDGYSMRKRFKKLGVKMAGGGAAMPGMSK